MAQEIIPSQYIAHESEKHPFDAFGPFYNKDSVIQYLSIDQHDLDELIAANEVIACQTQDGDQVFPVWQFEDKAMIKEWVGKVTPILAEGKLDNWMIALWLSTPVDTMNNQSAVQWLDAGGDIDVILQEAHHDASRWKL